MIAPWLIGGGVGCVIAWVVLPVLAQSKGESRCDPVSNLRLILTGMPLYTSDQDDLLPPFDHWEAAESASGPWNKSNQMAWRTSLDPYLKNDSLFIHPSRPCANHSGERIGLVSEAISGGLCCGYVEEIKAGWFGKGQGMLVLSPGYPPPQFMQEIGLSSSIVSLL